MPSNPTRQGTRAALAGPGARSNSSALTRYTNDNRREIASVGRINASESLERPVPVSDGSEEQHLTSTPGRRIPSNPDDPPLWAYSQPTSLNASILDVDEGRFHSGSRPLSSPSSQPPSSPSTALPSNRSLAHDFMTMPPRGESPASDDSLPTHLPGGTAESSSANGVSESPVSTALGGQCVAIIKKGTQCSRNARAGSDVCWQHKTSCSRKVTDSRSRVPQYHDDSDTSSDDVVSINGRIGQCAAIIKEGRQCRRDASGGSDVCWQHKNCSRKATDSLSEVQQARIARHPRGVDTTIEGPSRRSSRRNGPDVIPEARQVTSRPISSPPRAVDWNKFNFSVMFSWNKRTFMLRPKIDLTLFTAWVPSYLPSKTRKKLREKMMDPVSKSDRDGYIYAFEIRDSRLESDEESDFVIKVGRTINTAERMKDWREHFGSDDLKVKDHGWWPGNLDLGDTNDYESAISVLGLGRRTSINSGLKGKYHHRVERLVLLELKAVARYSLHLLPEFSGGLSRGGTEAYYPPRPHTPNGSCMSRTCDKIHTEIFRIKRVPGEKMTGKEWEAIVLPMIVKWGEFVDKYVHG